MERKILGDAGEDQASRYLTEQGYHIIERNYRLRCGEIDLIAEKDDFLVFVEVKTRTEDQFLRPASNVGRSKMNRIVRTSLYYMKTRERFDKMVRFDVIEICQDRLNHIEGAFEYSGKLGY